MKIPKFKIKRIKDFLQRLPRVLGEKAFLTFLGFLFLILIFGGAFFYKYNILVKKIEPEIIEKPRQFKEETYQDILKIWQEKENRFKEADLKTYPNPFR